MSNNLISNQSVLALDGEDDYLVIPNNDAINFDQNQNFCIELWLKVGTIAPGSNTIFDVNIIEKWQGGAFPYSMRYSSTKETVYASRYDGKNPSVSSKILVNDQKFHHVAFVKQDSQLFLYIDGIEQGQTQDTIIQSTQNDSPVYVAAGTSISKGGGTRRFFAGQIADIRLWNIARTPEEIQQKMNSRLTGKETGLVGYYPLNGDGDDKTSNANHGTINGNAIWQKEELPIQAAISDEVNTNNTILFFDGIDDNLILPKGFSTIDKAITIEFWAKGENSVTESTSVLEANNSQNARVLNVHLPWGNSWIFWDAGNENGFNRIDKGVKLEEYNSWTHWAFVKDVTTGKMYIYRQGEIWHQGEGNTKNLSGIQKFVIASSVNSSHYWKGSLTEFRIWNIARTPEEVKQNMNSRLTGKEPGLVGYYPLNGDGNDKTSNANHGIINGAIWKQEELPIQVTAANLLTESKIKLKSWKGDYLHRPDTAQDVTTWSTGVGNEWTVEALGDNKIKLKSWKGDYLHRPDTAQGVTTWSTGVGNEWELELISITNVEPINFPEQPNVLSFDGIDDYIKLPDGILTASYTKEAWIKLAEPPAQFNNILSGNQHALYVPNAIASGHNGQWAMVQTFQPCPKNTWLHVALTYDSQTRIMCLYQNGQLSSQMSNIPPFDPSDRTLDIGIHRNGYFFKGEITEVRVWNFARSQGMIQETMSYRLIGQETGLVGYWALNEGSGNVATDKTGKGNNGTINGAIWKQEELPIQAARFGEIESNVITGGNTPTKNGIADSNANFYIVDTNNPVNGNGELTGWEIWAENTLPVQLVIYRKEADIWSVVGQSEIKTPVIGLNQFSLSTPIKVNRGDFVGIYHPQAGCVSFFKDNDSAWAIGNLTGKVLFTGSGATSTAFSNSTNRTYSLSVKGNVVVATEPPVSKFVKIGTKGGSISAADFEFLPKDTAQKSRLKTVFINALWPICALQVEYENLASTPRETYRSALVGNSSGIGEEFSLQPGDYLIKVSGTWGSQAPGYPKEEIITLQFETKKGVKSPVFGGKSGTQEIVEAFVFEAPEGQEIIGFFGSHGGPQNFLVRLGIYCQLISIPENQEPTELVQPPESLVIPENQQPTESVLKLRKGFSFDEAILMTTFSKYAYDVFQYDDGSVDDVKLKTVYKDLNKNQGWQLVHTVCNDDTNIRGLVLKNTQSSDSHQYVISFRGPIVNDRSPLDLTDFAADFDWKLAPYSYLAIQRAKVVGGINLAFESVADEIQFFFKTLRGELKRSDFRRLHQLPPLRKFACITALADAGAIRLGTEFEQQAQELVQKVVADGEEREKILTFLEEELLSKLSPLTEPIEVWVTGHNLGACLSQIAGLSLRSWFGPASSGGLLIKVYAIAAPKIGNQQFVDYYNDQIGAELSYRIENVFDIVPTYPYDPPFPFSAIAPEGLRLGNTYIGKYANGGELITVMGFGSSQSTSISFGGLFNIPFSIPYPHSVETYIQLLKEQRQFWDQLVHPVKDVLRPFLLDMLRDEQRRDVNPDQKISGLNDNKNTGSVNNDEDITIIK